MNKTAKLSIIFASAFLVFLIAYLIIINPFAETDDYSSGGVDYDPSVGEGVYLNTPTMYDQYMQEEINVITVKNGNGIYRLCQPVKNIWLLFTYSGEKEFDQYLLEYEQSVADKTASEKRFSFTTDGSWTQITLSELYGERLAELRVAVGVAYYQSKITLDDTDSAKFEESLLSYGLDGKTYYEVDATKDGVDVKKKVYVGDYSASLNNYYLRIDGTNRVYVAQGNRSSLFKGAEYLVTPEIIKPVPTQSSYYMKDFSIYHNSNLINEATKDKYSPDELFVKKGDIVEIAYYIPGEKVKENGVEREIGDGDRIYAVYDTSDETLPQSLIEGLLGMKLYNPEGEGDKEKGVKQINVTYAPDYSEKLFLSEKFSWANLTWFNATQSYKAIDGDSYKRDEYQQRTTLYNVIVTGIIRSEKEFVKLGWLNQSEREPFFQHTTYKTSGTASDYTVNTDNFFKIVDLFENMKGAEVVSLNLNADTIKEYGLDAYTVYYKMPLGIENENDEDSDINIMVYKYDENALFISERDSEGYRYVGSWYYGTVVKVLDSESFYFLDWDFYEYVEETMFSTEIKYMDTVKFEFNYADKGKEEFVISLSHVFDDPENPDAYSTTVKINGKSVNTSDHAKLYTFLASIRYTGSCELSDADADTLYNDESKRILRLTFTLNENAGEENVGKKFVYCFSPYSTEENPSRHVMVSSDGEIFFSVNTSDIKKLYYDIGRLLRGESVDYNDRY